MTRIIPLAALLSLTAMPGLGLAAEPVHARYAAYAAGFNVLNLETDFNIAPQDYRIRVQLRTAGTFSAVVQGQTDTTVQGRFVSGRAQPLRFYSAGHMRGRLRVTQVDYPTGQPEIKQLVPPANEDDREPVPPDQQRGTIDTLSAMAQLMQQVGTTGRCEGRVVTFDGRRLAEMTARTAGQEVLEASSRSSYSGPALRCDFVGKQLGGFMRDEDRAELSKPQVGSAWFASVAPGAPPIPVRVAFHTRYFGSATMYLAGTGPASP